MLPCVGYTIAVFGLAWSDGKLSLLTGEGAKSLRELIQTHLVFLLMLILWIWLAQFSKPWLPSWVISEGDHRESWFLFFALLGIVAMLLYEHWWLASKPRPGLNDRDGQSAKI